jgi:hypothetical protein
VAGANTKRGEIARPFSAVIFSDVKEGKIDVSKEVCQRCHRQTLMPINKNGMVLCPKCADEIKNDIIE